MDTARVLDALGLSSKSWGPLGGTAIVTQADYDAFAAAWPTASGTVPTFAAMQTAAATLPPAGPRRTLFAIRTDLLALSAAQQASIWTAFIAGNPPLWATDAGSNVAALAALQMLGASVTLSAADVKEAKIRAAAMYTQDNPNWLIKPSFDATINVPGCLP